MNTLSASRPTLAHRILDSFPSGSYALGALLRLVDIVETDQVETAAVECRAQPRLLINPSFVARWAASSEKLLMLVMHELHHVLLGHTRLLPRATLVDNLVFDAVINAMLCRMFPEPQYTAMFTDFYRDDAFPECLLRPPQGFELGRTARVPPALATPGLAAVAEVYRALYSEKGATYGELYDVFRQLISDEQAATVLLIGDHAAESGSAAGGLTARYPVLFDAVRRIVEHWPQPPDPIRGRSLADLLKLKTVKPVREPTNHQRLRELLRRVGGLGCHTGQRLEWRDDTVPIQVPHPTFDRRSVVLRSLGVSPMLYGSQLLSRRQALASHRVHVYLDVSGSIGQYKAAMYAAVLDCREFVEPRIHLFSTVVADISLTDTRSGHCPTTDGTDIACVAEHIRSNRVRRAVLLTDGYVGRPSGIAAKTLSSVRLGIALTPGSTNRSDLEGFARYWTQLGVRPKSN